MPQTDPKKSDQSKMTSEEYLNLLQTLPKEEKVEELAAIVASYTGKFKMHIINLLPIQEAIVQNCPEEETTILVRKNW